MCKSIHTSSEIKQAIEQGYIWCKNEDGVVWKSAVNGVAYIGGEWQFILTYADRSITPPYLQCYQFKQVLSSNWELTLEALAPYKAIEEYREIYDYENMTKD